MDEWKIGNLFSLCFEILVFTGINICLNTQNHRNLICLNSYWILWNFYIFQPKPWENLINWSLITERSHLASIWSLDVWFLRYTKGDFGWCRLYYRRIEEGKQYPLLCRRLVSLNEEFISHKYPSAGFDFTSGRKIEQRLLDYNQEAERFGGWHFDHWFLIF